jgi:hypothetical protein
MAGRIPALQGETVGVYCLGRGTLAERRPVDARAAVLDTVRALGFHAVPLSGV